MRIPKKMSETLKQLLSDIEKGKVSVTAQIDVPMKKVAGGVVKFVTENNWQLFVFIDCGSWDYFHKIIGPDHTEMDYNTLDRILGNYRVSEKIAKLRYGVAGYLKFDRDCVHF